jgi:isoleucyl-tRNA synthetase
LTVALDVTLSDELKSEGIARELVNRVQNLRKDSGLEVTDRILLKVETNELIQNAIASNKEYVCNEVLANDVVFETLGDDALVTDLVDADDAKIGLVKG